MDQRKEARPVGIVGIMPYQRREEIEEFHRESSRLTDHPGMERGGYIGSAFVKAAGSPSKLTNHRHA